MTEKFQPARVSTKVFVTSFCAIIAPTSAWAECASATEGATSLDGTNVAMTILSEVSECPMRITSLDNGATLALPPEPVRSQPPFQRWTSPVRLAETAGSERERGSRLEWGDSAINIAGFRSKMPLIGPHPANLVSRHDRSALWGGNVSYDRALGPQDGLAINIEATMGKQRSGFTPQVAHRYSSQSFGAALIWQHNARFALSASFRANRSSAASSSLTRLAAHAAGSQLEGAAIHLSAVTWPLVDQLRDGVSSPLSLTFDAYRQRLSIQDAAYFSRDGGRNDSGVSLTLKAKF